MIRYYEYIATRDNKNIGRIVRPGESNVQQELPGQVPSEIRSHMLNDFKFDLYEKRGYFIHYWPCVDRYVFLIAEMGERVDDRINTRLIARIPEPDSDTEETEKKTASFKACLELMALTYREDEPEEANQEIHISSSLKEIVRRWEIKSLPQLLDYWFPCFFRTDRPLPLRYGREQERVGSELQFALDMCSLGYMLAPTAGCSLYQCAWRIKAHQGVGSSLLVTTDKEIGCLNVAESLEYLTRKPQEQVLLKQIVQLGEQQGWQQVCRLFEGYRIELYDLDALYWNLRFYLLDQGLPDQGLPDQGLLEQGRKLSLCETPEEYAWAAAHASDIEQIAPEATQELLLAMAVELGMVKPASEMPASEEEEEEGSAEEEASVWEETKALAGRRERRFASVGQTPVVQKHAIVMQEHEKAAISHKAETTVQPEEAKTCDLIGKPLPKPAVLCGKPEETSAEELREELLAAEKLEEELEVLYLAGRSPVVGEQDRAELARRFWDRHEICEIPKISKLVHNLYQIIHMDIRSLKFLRATGHDVWKCFGIYELILHLAEPSKSFRSFPDRVKGERKHSAAECVIAEMKEYHRNNQPLLEALCGILISSFEDPEVTLHQKKRIRRVLREVYPGDSFEELVRLAADYAKRPDTIDKLRGYSRSFTQEGYRQALCGGLLWGLPVLLAALLSMDSSRLGILAVIISLCSVLVCSGRDIYRKVSWQGVSLKLLVMLSACWLVMLSAMLNAAVAFLITLLLGTAGVILKKRGEFI